LIYRGDKQIGECWREFQKYYGINDIFFQQFIRNNFHRLKLSPQCLWIPSTHGGLGQYFVHSEIVNQKLGKKVYFCSLFKRLFSERSQTLKLLTENKVDCLSIPVYLPSLDKNTQLCNRANEIVLDKIESFCLTLDMKEQKFLSHKDLSSFEKKVLPSYSHLQKIINDPTIYCHHLPSLEDFSTIVKFVPSLLKEEASRFHHQSFFNSFGDYVNSDEKPIQFLESKFLYSSLLNEEEENEKNQLVQSRKSWMEYVDNERGPPPEPYDNSSAELEFAERELDDDLVRQERGFDILLRNPNKAERFMNNENLSIDLKHSDFNFARIYEKGTLINDLQLPSLDKDNIFSPLLTNSPPALVNNLSELPSLVVDSENKDR